MRRLLSPAVVLLLFTTLGGGPTPAMAQDAVKMEVVKVGQVGQAGPAFVVRPQVPLDNLAVDVACGSVKANHKGPAKSGEVVTLALPVSTGRHKCSGRLAILTSGGEEGEMPLSFEVTMHPPLKVSVPRESVDLSGRHLSVVLDRPARSVQVEVVGPGGVVIGHGNQDAGNVGAGQPISVSWTDSGDEIIQLRVVGTDADGFWGQVDLSPWAYEVPHIDVVFASGQAVIQPEEAHKLEAALAEVDKVVAKYGAIAKINLYVAGYTDTVGSAATNQTLSKARARAIAEWFKAHGFAHPVYYQGFGEQGLAVATPDETDEAANRRAAYIVAAEPPPVSGAIAGSNWTPL